MNDICRVQYDYNKMTNLYGMQYTYYNIIGMNYFMICLTFIIFGYEYTVYCRIFVIQMRKIWNTNRH